VREDRKPTVFYSHFASYSAEVTPRRLGLGFSLSHLAGVGWFPWPERQPGEKHVPKFIEMVGRGLFDAKSVAGSVYRLDQTKQACVTEPAP
jgi:hypothetical protein